MTDVKTKEESWTCGCVSEHRPTIGRAWCFACTEWCYPNALCVRGEVEVAREVVKAAGVLVALMERYTDDGDIPWSDILAARVAASAAISHYDEVK